MVEDYDQTGSYEFVKDILTQMLQTEDGHNANQLVYNVLI